MLVAEEEIKAYRATLDGLKVRGKHCPPPIKNWFLPLVLPVYLAIPPPFGVLWKLGRDSLCQVLTKVQYRQAAVESSEGYGG